MGRERRRRLVAVACLAAAAALGTTVDAVAQLFPIGPGEDSEPTPTSESTTTTQSTTTTAPPVTLVPTTAPPAEDSTTTTEPPAGEAPSTTDPAPADPGSPAPEAPASEGPVEGEGGAGPGVAGGAVPPEAQAVIDSIVRTPPGDNSALVDGAALLEAAGVPREEAMRAVFGRFPIHGPTRWSDDWLYPRWTGTQFRFHQGLDLFAPFGTPVAAPVDGVARIGDNALGGLTVRVVEPDGTYWYLAHLSGIADGLVDGQPVTTGQVVGFVGDSGNARGGVPHLHFGVYPQGGAAAPPKPVVDAWVAEGAARVPELLARLVAAPAGAAGPADRTPAGADVGPPAPAGPSRSELLWASAANPTGGAVQVAEAAAAAASRRVDWERRATVERALDLAWARSADRARHLLGPLTNPVLRQVVEGLRTGVQ